MVVIITASTFSMNDAPRAPARLRGFSEKAHCAAERFLSC
jgi:hypothetical protein